jgi:hypothetical protein
MATRSANVNMVVKWRLNPGKRFVCSSWIQQTLWPLMNVVFGNIPEHRLICELHSRLAWTLHSSICSQSFEIDYRPATFTINSLIENFHETSSENPLSSGHKFYWTQLEHTKRFPWLGRHCTTMSTFALLVAIVRVTTLLQHSAICVISPSKIFGFISACSLPLVNPLKPKLV